MTGICITVLNLSHMGLSLNHIQSYVWRRDEMFSCRDLEAKSSGFNSLQEDKIPLHIPCLGPGMSMDNLVLPLSGCHRWGEIGTFKHYSRQTWHSAALLTSLTPMKARARCGGGILWHPVCNTAAFFYCPQNAFCVPEVDKKLGLCETEEYRY